MVTEAGPPDYRGMEILSPMVRGSSLPLRLCCLRNGADLVYHGCQVDRRVLETTRLENKTFGCVDYVSAREGRTVFSTCAEERQHVVFQIGTCDAALATQAALHVCRDVRGVDVNMGCTASFTTSGGMGSELLEKPELAADILKSLRRELPPECAVSCKVRMLPDMARTRDFLQLCERSGAQAVAVHMRRADENWKDKGSPAHWSDIGELCSAVQIPIIANGDFWSRSRITEFWRQQEAASGKDGARPAGVMIARGALWNPSIFSKEDVSFDDAVREYVRTAISTGNAFENSKWALREMTSPAPGKPVNQSFGQLQGKAQRKFRNRVDLMVNIEEMCQIFDVSKSECDYPPNAFSLDYSFGLLQAQSM